MNTELEREAEFLWDASQKYSTLASKHFFLDVTFDRAKAMELYPEAIDEINEIAGLLNGAHLPEGHWMGVEAQVHFLFPNLDNGERVLLNCIFIKRERNEEIQKLRKAFENFDVEKKMTAVQLVIVEKWFLPEK